MLYYLFEYLERAYQFPGASLFSYLTFRSAVAIIFSLLVTALLGKRIIAMLQHYQMGESIRDLGLEGQKEKAGTPTMGGLMIIFWDTNSCFTAHKTGQYLHHTANSHHCLDGCNWVC